MVDHCRMTMTIEGARNAIDRNELNIFVYRDFVLFRSWMSDVQCPISYRQFEHILLNPGYDEFVDLCLAQKNFSLSLHLTLEAVGNLFTLCSDRDIFDAICLSEILGLGLYLSKIFTYVGGCHQI